MLIFHWFYKGLRKKSCCGCSGVGASDHRTAARAYFIFANVVKPMVSATFSVNADARKCETALPPALSKSARTP